MKNSKGFTLTGAALAICVGSIFSAVVVKQSVLGIKTRAIGSEAIRMLSSVESASKGFFMAYGYAPENIGDLEDSGFISSDDLEGVYLSSTDIDQLLGEQTIPIGKNGLKEGCGLVDGITICKSEKGGYTISGKYKPDPEK